jgi:cation diffusion facilitator family transporter
MPHTPPRFPLVLSIAAAVVTMAMKGVAFWLTGSVGIFSDAVESTANVIAALTAYFSLLYAARPVDPSHTYGHEKIEYFSSGLEGVLILVGAAGAAWYAVVRLQNPQTLQSLGFGVVLALGATLINYPVARILLRVGRQTESIVLEADGQHLMTDVWTSLGVVAGLVLAYWTGWEVLDPIIALLVAAYIVRSGVELIVRSFNGLMDHALPEKEQGVVRHAIDQTLPSGVTYHALRTRQAGARRFADFHLLVPGAWSVKQAHDLTSQVEKAVQGVLPGIEVTVHIEPIEEPAAYQDSELLPLEKGQPKGIGPG